MGYSKRLLDGLNDEELERLFGQPEEEPWPSEDEIERDNDERLNQH